MTHCWLLISFLRVAKEKKLRKLRHEQWTDGFFNADLIISILRATMEYFASIATKTIKTFQKKTATRLYVCICFIIKNPIWFFFGQRNIKHSIRSEFRHYEYCQLVSDVMKPAIFLFFFIFSLPRIGIWKRDKTFLIKMMS